MVINIVEREARRYHCHRGEKKTPQGVENRLACGGSVCLQAQVRRETPEGLSVGQEPPLELWTGSWWEGSAEAGEGCRGPMTLPARPAPKRAGMPSCCVKGEVQALVASLRFTLPPEVPLEGLGDGEARRRSRPCHWVPTEGTTGRA